MFKLLVDGVFFQLHSTGIARVWKTVLELLAESHLFSIYLLDRGSAPEIDGIFYIEFPAYEGVQCAADSVRIQAVCDQYHIDLFTSTYYTSPLRTPMLLMMYDMIPELLGFDLSPRIWQEKAMAISYAQQYLCISENTRRDLLSLYPEIPEDKTSVAYCGVDESVFYQRSEEDIAAFRMQYGLYKRYFLLVGLRGGRHYYKNAWLFFDAVSTMEQADFDVLCVGGEEAVEQEFLDNLPEGVGCQRIRLSDDELAMAYGGAIALVYPSLYEGFGMPVIEAMAAGCPVITTHHGSLAEAAGDAALLVDGTSVEEMQQALLRIQDTALQESLRAAGYAQAQQFRWQGMVDKLAADLQALYKDAEGGAYADFFAEWSRLRLRQADVDDLYQQW